MIPKRIFFIWLGNKPEYADFCINSFKKVNPEFDFRFINYTIEQLENINNCTVCEYDEDLINCINYVKNGKDKYSELISEYKKYGRKFVQIIANILRLILINKYGGIYLDCDTFPLKPFDSELLNNEAFCTSTYTTTSQKERKCDCFFLGCKTGFYRKDYYFPKRYETHDMNYMENKEWWKRRELFYKLKLPIIISKDSKYYIDHFQDRTWQHNKTPICKYD